jgi:hypothetical protein
MLGVEQLAVVHPILERLKKHTPTCMYVDIYIGMISKNSYPLDKISNHCTMNKIICGTNNF